MRCPYCGAETKENICEYCDSDLSFMTEREIPEPEPVSPEQRPFVINTTQQDYSGNDDLIVSSKSEAFAMFLCVISLMFQIHGLHRFYVGKTASGLFYLFTFGGFYIGTIIDMISIANGSFTDNTGRPLR